MLRIRTQGDGGKNIATGTEANKCPVYLRNGVSAVGLKPRVWGGVEGNEGAAEGLGSLGAEERI